MLPMVGPPPPKLRRGHIVPPPNPPKPRLKPLTVKPHCDEPTADCQADFTALQSCPLIELMSAVGSSRLVMTFSPDPAKKLSRQVSDVTLCGAGMLVSSAWMRAAAPSTAAWTRVAQPAL